MPYVELDKLRFHYQTRGEGTDVILIHAFTSNSSIWLLTNIVDELSKEFRVTTYDLRGHGATDVPQSGYESSQMVDDLVQLQDALGLGAAYLVGHSYGGVIGMHAAYKCPDRVLGVVLSDTYFPGMAELEPNMGQAEPWGELREHLAACGREIGETVDFSRLFRTIREMDDNEFQVIKDRLGIVGARWLSSLSKLSSTSAGEEAFQPDGLGSEQLSHITQPVVALYDEFSPFHATCQFLKDHLPNVAMDVVPGAKHLAPLQNSTAFVSLVQGHLRRLAGIPTAVEPH